MAKTALPRHIDPNAHCIGCYDPETCPGIVDRLHCADCVLEDQLELEIMAGVYETEAHG